MPATPKKLPIPLSLRRPSREADLAIVHGAWVSWPSRSRTSARATGPWRPSGASPSPSERGEVFGLLGPNGAGQDHHRRDPRGLPRSQRGRRRRARPRPRPARPPPPGAGGDRAPGLRLLPAPDRARGGRPHGASAYPAPRDTDETIEPRGPRATSADVRSGRLSGGQRRRLDLALALVGDPELVFLDEPTTGFDPAARRAAWEVVRTLRDLGKTVLLTTHYLDEAQALADRVAIVKDGTIVAAGPPVGAGAFQRRLPRLVPLRRGAGRAPDRRSDRPAAPPHRRRDRARRAPRGPRGGAPDARGGLSRADLGGRPGERRMSAFALAWRAVSPRAQAVLAQPERRLLLVRAAAGAAAARGLGVRQRRTTSWRCSSRASPA